MSDPLAPLDASEREAAVRAEQPRWIEPMLATLTDDRFSDPDWIFERKLDGVRLIVFRSKDGLRLVTRNRKERSATYPILASRLAQLKGPDRWVADGEVVAFDGDVTSFSRLQHRLGVEDESEARRRARSVAVRLYLFDLLHLDGWDLTSVPLRGRKKILRHALAFDDPVRYTPHRNEVGIEVWKDACARGWEGIIAKDARAPYVHGRSRSWLKFKCVRRQELVVGGFTEPHGSRVGFGALLLGYHDEEGLVYAGKVGTGWDEASLRTLREQMNRLERKTSPFDAGDPPAEGVRWITPKLVVEIGFTEWTDDGRLRHPRYLGLRTDKEARDVVRERPS